LGSHFVTSHPALQQISELRISEEQVEELTDKIEAVARERYAQWLRGEG
jgi:hypothetical protein